MTALLLDTNVILWLYAGNRNLGSAAQDAIRNADLLAYSEVSLWEIAIKCSLGKLVASAAGLADRLDSDGASRVGMANSHATALASLEWPASGHRDPFDRMLVAQARTEKLTLVTADLSLQEYRVRILDARV